jgi:peptide deformylase
MKILTLSTDVENLLITQCPPYQHTTLVDDLVTATEMMQFIGKQVGKVICVGLAAPQVGVMRRFFLMVNRDTKKILFCFDPRIERHGKDLQWAEEGCLSCPGESANVPRWKIIDVEYTNENGQLIRSTFRGFNARVFQHELDHLNGMLIVKHPGQEAERVVGPAEEAQDVATV